MPASRTRTRSRMPTTTTPKADRATAPSGILVVDKPSGWTSHQVVGRVRRLAGTRKVGHAGTLDPMATGVLVVGVERATRLLGHLSLTTKEYRATIRLGQATVTDDAEGDISEAPGAGGVTADDIATQLVAFRGDIVQAPSAVSAIKVNGVRSYARVRAGEEVELVGRPVTVSRLDVVRVQPTAAAAVPVVDVDIEVECSSGTYIRALARDLGAALEVGGHLTALRRTRVGPFQLSQAQTLEQAADRLALVDISDVARLCFPTYTVSDEQAQRVSHGGRLSQVTLPAPTTALMTSAGSFLALYRPEASDAVAISVFTG
jgi:tRNA pseudouridine55 synthase